MACEGCLKFLFYQLLLVRSYSCAGAAALLHFSSFELIIGSRGALLSLTWNIFENYRNIELHQKFLGQRVEALYSINNFLFQGVEQYSSICPWK